MYQRGLHVLLKTCPQYLNNNKIIDNAKLAWKKVNKNHGTTPNDIEVLHIWQNVKVKRNAWMQQYGDPAR